MNILQKLFDNNERDIKRYRKIAEKINALEPEFEQLGSDALRAKTDEFRARIQEAVGDDPERNRHLLCGIGRAGRRRCRDEERAPSRRSKCSSNRVAQSRPAVAVGVCRHAYAVCPIL